LFVLPQLRLQSVGLIISGIITATAAHMTEKARQRNINFAGQSMAAIGVAMTAAAIQQPPHQFASDACCVAGSSGSASEAGSSAASAVDAGGSFRKGEHARGMSVSWDAAAAGSGKLAGLAGGLHVRIEEAEADSRFAAAGALVSPGVNSAVQYYQYGMVSPGGLQTDAFGSWTLQQVTAGGLQASESNSSSFGGASQGLVGGSSSICSSPTAAARRGAEWSSGGGSTSSPDCPANTLSGGKSPAAAAAGCGAVADGEVRWLMESSADQIAQQQDVAAEAQLALAELRSEASVATIGVGVGRASFGRRVLGQQGSAADSYKAREGILKASGDADGLDLDDADGPGSSSCEMSWAADHAGQSQPNSTPSSPKRAGAAAAGFGSNSGSSGGSGQQQQQQQPGCHSGRASLAVSSSRRGSVAADGGGGVYSVLSELDLSQNPLGATGAKVVAEVRGCLICSLHVLSRRFQLELATGPCSL
jgi:hypothetical protein